ncbi:MAG: bifunctional DNA-formamidopyrimidine glycosylase/DNA-(apurinic or apyrimidinic site) lyase [Alphaproteobacteria bacterium]|nr:bifunctional DNA-formamidopyrimidine glycosylase/DNA-(apurinic or apyrimidinic site) lyase [Alphaproteobacteria bacterium]
MPELPEVETVRRGLAARLTGRTVVGAVQRRPDLRIALPERFAQRLVGRRLRMVGRRAKYLLLHFEDASVLLIHLGMSGRLVLNERASNRSEPHDHVILTWDDGAVLVYNDARRFGLMTLSDEASLAGHTLLRGLGPEPLGDEFDGPSLSAALAGKRTPIKAALLDQRVVAGLGNIYVCEALFRAMISPRRPAHTVAGRRAARLAPAIRAVLGEAIAAGGSSLRDYVQADGGLGAFQNRFQVYDREGRPCPACHCGGGVRRIVQSGRSTFYCPTLQR